MRTRAVIVGAAVLILGWIVAGPSIPGPEPGSGVFLHAMSDAKSVGMAAYAYAEEHQGRLPETLQELIPNYVSNDALLKHTHLTMPGVLLKDLPPKSILLVRTATHPKRNETRLVFVRADGSVDLERRTKSE